MNAIGKFRMKNMIFRETIVLANLLSRFELKLELELFARDLDLDRCTKTINEILRKNIMKNGKTAEFIRSIQSVTFESFS